MLTRSISFIYGLLQPRSYPQNHPFRGLDQRRRTLSGLQPHLLSGIRGDDRGDLLFANLQSHLPEQAAVLHIHNTAKQFIPPACLPKITTPRPNVSPFHLFANPTSAPPLPP